jgi:putative flavoprotein involved in K+ transport
MTNIDTVIIGAGHAGIAVSWCLDQLGHDHVVLERGRVAERWRSARWDSLRTLTPNWMTRLPGADYSGPDPDGFMAVHELVAHFEAYAGSFAAPVLERTPVDSVVRRGDGFEVVGGRRWHARNVVIATGWADEPHLPASASELPRRVQQLTAASYRRPAQIQGDRVLVVGASASGSQIADELASSGREVTLAAGRHRRVPRRYRGHDIMWWFDDLGLLDRPARGEDERQRLVREPSLQLAASRAVDLGSLRENGVAVAGHLTGVADGHAWFADDLDATVADADRRLRSLLARIDERADRLGAPRDGDCLHPVDLPPAPRSLALGPAGVDAVIWATGYRRSYPWLHIPVLDAGGEIRHDRGITPVPGLYVAGMRCQSGRRSTFIDGARVDAPLIAQAIERRSTRERVA